ncbi:cytochrome P450, partial [Trifolium medium]|nr:cytochrome P450 [Trifolium medium]
MNNIRMGSGLLDDRWLLDNISRQVGDGASSLFWKDPWLDGVSLDARYAKLFDLAVIKFATVLRKCSHWVGGLMVRRGSGEG